MNEKIVVPGAYSWLFTQDRSGSVFLGLPAEDKEKQERVFGSEEWRALAPGMLAVISGRIEEGETGAETIAREGWEEQGLLIDPTIISNSFPPITIEQQNAGRHFVINGTGHKFRMTEPQIAHVREKRRVEVIEHGALLTFLQENKNILRPFVYVVGLQLLQEGLLYTA